MSGDELDRLIDRELDAYVARDPLPGLEARVLRRARRKAPHRARWWAGCAVAACALLSFLADRTLNRPLEALAIHPVWRTDPPPSMTPVRSRRQAAPPRKLRLTPAQLALLQFVRDHPDQAIETVSKLKNPIEIEPLAIEEIKIQEETKK